MPIYRKPPASDPAPRQRREERPAKITSPEIKRLIRSLKTSGVDIAAVCFKPDGEVKFLTPSMAIEADGSAFDEWKDRL